MRLNQIQIGTLKLQGKTVLAPLAGITSLPFRCIVKACGCALVCSEMVSANGLFYNSAKTFTMLETHSKERPVSIQIFGSDPKAMAMAAETVEKRGGVDVIDINMGCSVKKVVKTGAGVALMQDIANAEKIIRAVRASISIPVTIKIRSGSESSGRQALDISQMAEKCGVDAVVLHPRTASQKFRGRADWSLIRKLKQNLSIPLIGNGDITTAADGIRMLEETGCDAVMVGRGAMANPFILAEIDDLIRGKPCGKRPVNEIFTVMKELLCACVDYFGEDSACKMMRSRLAWFVKGWPGCSKFRHALAGIVTKDQALELITSYQNILEDSESTLDTQR